MSVIHEAFQLKLLPDSLSSQCHLLVIAWLVYSRREQKVRESKTETAAAAGTCHAMECGVIKFDATPGGGGMAGTGSMAVAIIE